MTITTIIDSLSNHRFSTYQLPVLGGITKEECLGIYLWNKQLASAFFPALQIIEVSLRNAIYQGYIRYEEIKIENTFNQEQWQIEKNKIDKLWFINVFTQQNNAEAYRNILTATRQLQKDGKTLTPENYIAKLTLGFWISMVNNSYDIQRNSYLTLWPKLRGLVFPYALDIQTQRPLSINSIGNELKEINKIRNRLSHHEPLWRSKNAYQVEHIINKVVESYEKCLKVIKWINPSNLKLLSIIENNIKMSELCNIHSLWKNKQLSAGLSSLPIITGWGDENKLDATHIGKIIKIVDTRYALIKSQKDKAIFFASAKDMKNDIQNYSTGTLVRFIPEASPNQYPNAKNVEQA
ncbi:Abi family protein [Photorhabdus sp. P32]|uniref:Abi family protein n=1 Tax=Photorhabdus sp. P32 TaxID=3117549 RepID=UPI00311ACF1B